MAPVGFLLLGFFLGLLSFAIAEAAALLWAIRSLLARRRPLDTAVHPPPEPPPIGDLKRQGFLWMLEQEKTPKVSPSNGASQGVKHKKTIVEVFPVKMLAKLHGHSLTLSAPDGSQHNVHLLSCTAVAVSSSNLPSRKWAKRYPIKLESKESEICRKSKVCYVYAATSWEKESWCKALRLASTPDKDKQKFHAMLTEEFCGYVSSLNAGYPCFRKCLMLSGQEHVVDSTVKTDGSSKVRNFLKRLSKKASIKASPESKTNLMASKQDIKEPSTPSSSASVNSQLSDCPHANVEEKLADDGTLCWNLLFSRLFFDAKMSDDVNRAIKARIQRTLSNTRTPAYIGEITLAGLNLGKLPPCLHRTRVLPQDLNDLCAFEVDFEYSGGLVLHIETRLNIREPELENDIMSASLKDNSSGDVSSDVLDSIEQYGNQFRSSEALDSALEDNDEADALRKLKSTGWTSTYMSRWKSILHSIADQVSQVPLSLAIKISRVRGTMRIRIKPPPSDRIWYGFTSMPGIEWELESSVGDRKITNSHIASLISNRIKASLHQSLVLPNCESIPISWMISDTDDWVPRKIAPFIWLNREPTETSTRPPSGKTRELPGEASVLMAIAKNKSTLPASSARSKNESAKKTKICVDGSEQAEASTSSQSRLVSASGVPLQLQSSEDATRDQLRMPLLSSSSSSRDDRAMVVAAGTSAGEEAGDVKRKRGGRRVRVMDLGRRMGGKLEEKGKHIVGKMRAHARSNSLLLQDLERATNPAPGPS